MRSLKRLLTLLLLVSAGCASRREPGIVESGFAGDPTLDLCSGLLREVRELAIFRHMPPPAYRHLSYAVTGERERIQTDFTLATNAANCVSVRFVNYLTHGINPGVLAGYSDLLTLASISSNTLPVIRTVYRATVQAVAEIEGELFPLQVGNTLRFRVMRWVELRDASNRMLNRAEERLFCEHRVKSRQDGYPESQPPVRGDVWVIEQTVRGPSGETRRELFFSPVLGACVRVITLREGESNGEVRLTHWW